MRFFSSPPPSALIGSPADVFDPPMIFSKDDLTTPEEPPSYLSLAGPSSPPAGVVVEASSRRSGDDKSRYSSTQGSSEGSRWGPSPAPPVGWLATWMGTTQTKQDQEVRLTVLGLLHGIIQQGDSSDSIPIVQSSMDACRARGLSFVDIAQEPSVQGHTPLYWTIVKGVFSNIKPGETSSSTKDGLRTLFGVLLSFPLASATYSDAVQACLLTSSHETFMLLQRHNPNPPPSIPSHDVSEYADDNISVTIGDAEAALDGSFKVDINIKHFQRRMRLLKLLPIEFIARGRLWALTFAAFDSKTKYHQSTHHMRKFTQGRWMLMLDLIENSPATPVVARVKIGQEDGFSRSPSLEPIVIRLQSPKKDAMLSSTRRGQIVVDLWEQTHGASLEFDNCPYIENDGSLNVILEAKLAKPVDHPDCTIM